MRSTYARQVILIFHVIPDDLEWTRDQMSIPITDTALLIDEAEAADIVYSVSHNVYDYFKAQLYVTYWNYAGESWPQNAC